MKPRKKMNPDQNWNEILNPPSLARAVFHPKKSKKYKTRKKKKI